MNLSVGVDRVSLLVGVNREHLVAVVGREHLVAVGGRGHRVEGDHCCEEASNRLSSRLGHCSSLGRRLLGDRANRIGHCLLSWMGHCRAV